MAEENSAQESEQEQEQEQNQEQVQGMDDSAQEPAQDKQEATPPVQENRGGGLLLPFLYALLAAIGVFTLVMIAGIVLTFFTRPADPSGSPSSSPSSQSTPSPTRARQWPDAGDFHADDASKGFPPADDIIHSGSA